MSFRLTHELPKKCVVAVSGGVDSLSALHFLSRVEGRVCGVVHVNHSSGGFADEAEAKVREICREANLPLNIYKIKEDRVPGESRENHWRDQRYRFFQEDTFLHRLPIVLAHNMDDCFEEYITCTMVKGFLGTIPYQHGPCVRPFRLWKRRDIEIYAQRNGIQWINDPSNSNEIFQRVRIRRHVAPRIRFLNPGIYNVIEKAVREQDIWDSRST